MAVQAVQAIGRMRGGAQSQLMLGSDGRLLVVKFQNNPQGVRVLANEWLATRLAGALGLPVPDTAIVEVSEWLVSHSPDLWVEVQAGTRERCRAGLQFGCDYAGGEEGGQVLDYLPEAALREVRNAKAFAGMLVLDKWTGNCNGRQAVFVRGARQRTWRALFIDQGFCFNAGCWSFPDAAKRGVYGRNCVYEGVTGWESFEPWLSRLEEMRAEAVWRIAEEIPPEWCGGGTDALEQLVEELLGRRKRVRELIEAFRESDRMPFPAWRSRASVAMGTGWPLTAGVM